MQTLTQQVIDQGLANRVLSETQLMRLFDGSPQRRHNLVNRAMKAGELLRLRRGVYLLDVRFRETAAHPFALAQAFVPGCYVSFETALAHHGWIPEAVFTTACVTPGRKSLEFEASGFGLFSFNPLAIVPGHFYELVERRQINQQTLLIASPLRALIDIVCQRKIEWQGMGWLTDGMRIEHESLSSITDIDLRTLDSVYRHKRVGKFLHHLARELGHD